MASIVYIPKSHNSFGLSNLLTGNYFHLWFVGSLIVGYLFIWYLFFIRKNKILPYISLFILLLVLLTDSYDNFINEKLSFDLARFLLSIPFMYIGIYLSKKKFTQINSNLLIGLVIIGLVIQFSEAELLLYLFEYEIFTYQILIGTVITVIPLFILSSTLKIKENKLSKWGEKYSLFIYLYHPMVGDFLLRAFNQITSNYYKYISNLSPLIIFILMLIISFTLCKFIN